MTAGRILSLLLVPVLAACDAGGGDGGSGKPFQRVDIDVLLRSASVVDNRGIDVDTARNAIGAARECAAATALWRALDAARDAGLKELYGVEIFGVGEPDYEAHFFVLPRKGEPAWLYAQKDYHLEGREDADTVPSWPIRESQFDRLRHRFAAEFPLPNDAHLGTDVEDGALYLLHSYRDGESRAVLWLSPGVVTPNLESRSQHQTYLVTFAAQSRIRALWAALPLDALPDDPSLAFDWYAQAPAYPVPPPKNGS